MNGVLLAGAILGFLLTLAHGVGGHVTNLRKLHEGREGDGERLEIAATWHLYTWQLALTTLLLAAVLLGWVPSSPALRGYVAATYAGGAVVIALHAARRGAMALARHPQWAFLGAL